MVELIDADRAPSSRRRVVSGETYSDTPLGGPATTPYMVCQSGQKQTPPRRAAGTQTSFLAALGSIRLTQAPTALFRPPWPARATQPKQPAEAWRIMRWRSRHWAYREQLAEGVVRSEPI